MFFNSKSARRDLNFAPTPYELALRETIEYFLERGPEISKSLEDRYPPVLPRSRERALVERYSRGVQELEDRLTDEWLNEAINGL